MPLYVYHCSECEIEVEEIRPMTRADDPLACPLCARPCTRALTTFTIGAGRREAPATNTNTPPTLAHAVGCPCCAPRKRT